MGDSGPSFMYLCLDGGENGRGGGWSMVMASSMLGPVQRSGSLGVEVPQTDLQQRSPVQVVGFQSKEWPDPRCIHLRTSVCKAWTTKSGCLFSPLESLDYPRTSTSFCRVNSCLAVTREKYKDHGSASHFLFRKISNCLSSSIHLGPFVSSQSFLACYLALARFICYTCQFITVHLITVVTKSLIHCNLFIPLYIIGTPFDCFGVLCSGCVTLDRLAAFTTWQKTSCVRRQSSSWWPYLQLASCFWLLLGCSYCIYLFW